jgi:putative ABC transport system permease protein
MFVHDLRSALRLLARNPGFTLTVAATLAIGVAANTAIFTIVHSVLWRPLPYRDPARLVQLWETNPDRGWIDAECAPANFADWRRLNRSFSGLAAYSGAGRDPVVSNLTLTGIGEPERVTGVSVTGHFFSVLGVQAAAGRTFDADEEFRGRDDVVVLSQGFWRAQLGGDRAIIGGALELSGRRRRIIGVLPQGFEFGNAPVDVWIPMGWTREEMTGQRRAHLLRVIGRLQPGVSIDRANADLQRIARDLEREYPTTNTHMAVGAGSLRNWMVGSTRAPLLLLLGAVGFVLLVACANIANLLLARGVSRQRELAVRAALGASVSRVVRQMLTESLLLAAVGGAIGLGAAYGAVRAIVAHAPASLPRLHEIGIDRVALAFTVAVTTLTGMIFGVVPARHLAAANGSLALKSARQVGSASRSWARNALIVAELAVSLTLLVGATLLIRSFVKLNRVELGFETRGVIAFRLPLPRVSFGSASAQNAAIDRLITLLRSVPGIAQAGAAQRLVLNGLWTSDFTVEHRPPDDFGIEVHHNQVSPGYFDVIGVPIIRGRGLTDGDRAGKALVVVVNEALVRRYFGAEDPIGHRLNFDRPGGSSPWRTIVGVVSDFREEKVDAEVRPTIYEALLQTGNSDPGVVLRTSRDLTDVVPLVRAAVRDVDPRLALADATRVEDLVQKHLAPQRFTTTMMVLFAITSVTLTIIGLYGVLTYLVNQRSQEVGVRMALGATTGDIAWLVAGQASKLVVAGLAVGSGMALATSRLLSGLLFGVGTVDPLTYATAILALLFAAAVATGAPIARTVRVNPIVALRSD